MIVESPTRPGYHTDIPLKGPTRPARRESHRPGHAATATMWRPARAPRLCRTGLEKGLATGVPLIDDTLGGLRPGATYVLRSPAGESVEAARAVLAAADAVGLGGRVVDPAIMLRHAVPETMDGPWSVERPATLAALTRDGRAGVGADAGAFRLLVVAAPGSLWSPHDRKAMARFARWAQATMAGAAASAGCVVFVLPWSGPVPDRAFGAIERQADRVVRFERLVEGGLSARDVHDGRIRVVDRLGHTDAVRERRARRPMPWGLRSAV